MTPRPTVRPAPTLKPATLRTGVAWVLLAGIAWCAGNAIAQSGPPTASATPRPPTAVRPAAPKPEEGPRWQKLRPAQRDALKPLQQEWAGIDASSKQKWVQLADRMPDMHADERSRVQDRMSDWAKLTPAERGQARLRYQEAKQVPPSDRRSRWDDYQALPPEQKSELAARAAAARKTPPTAQRGLDLGTVTVIFERGELAGWKVAIGADPAATVDQGNAMSGLRSEPTYGDLPCCGIGGKGLAHQTRLALQRAHDVGFQIPSKRALGQPEEDPHRQHQN